MRFLSLQKTYLKFYLLFLRPYSNIFLCLALALLFFSFSPSIEALLLKHVIEILGKTPSDTMAFFYILNQHVFISSAFNIIVSSIKEYIEALYYEIMPKIKKEILYNLCKYFLKYFGYSIQDYFGGYVLNTSYITADILNNIVCSILYNFIFFLMNMIFSIFLIYTVSPLSAFILILGSAFIIIFIYLTSSKKVLTENVITPVKYTYTAREIIKRFINIIFEKTLYMKKTGVYFSLYKNGSDHEITDKESRRDILLKLLLEISSMIFICFQIYILILQRQKSEITIGDFIFILTLSISVIGTSWDITYEYIFIYSSIMKCSKLVYYIMNKRNESYRKKLYVRKGEIHFRKVSFLYENEKNLFLNLSVKIKGCEKVGILGKHGSGRTTFVSLILNQTKLHSGSILIDGQNIKNVSQESLQNNICFIPNYPIFFQRTIMENIVFGCPHVTIEEAIKSAEKAKLAEFINSIPKGYHTPLKEIENGFTNLQRKKLAFARVLVKNPKILILDERSAHIDLETEIYVRNVLEQTEDKTLLIVTQHPSIAQLMDRLFIFSDGTIVEEGTPESLLKKRGLYKELYEMALHPTNI